MIKDGKHLSIGLESGTQENPERDISEIAYVLPIDDFLLLKGLRGRDFVGCW
jgi:hypothetical protein